MTENPFSPHLLAHLSADPRKVVLLRASRIGDFLCASPALRALRMALPRAEISMITLPILKEIVARSPYLDRFIPFPGFPGLAEQFFNAPKAVKFLQEMQEEHFDLAIQMQGTGVNSNPFMLLLGARATAGFVRPGDSPGLLNAALPFPETAHEIRRVLALTTFLGAPSQGEELVFPLWPEDHAEAASLLCEIEAPFIGLHPSARDLSRRWFPERFAAVGNRLQERHGGTVVLLGDEEACEAGKRIEQELHVPFRNLIDRTTLSTLGGIMTRLSVMLTNDSGPAHIAYALRVPTVTIFGSSSPLINGPLQPGPFRVLAHPVPCRSCNDPDCPAGLNCLQDVTAQEAGEAAEEIMR